MATTIVPEPNWTALDDRALALFCSVRYLTWDDSLLAALVEQRAPALAQRALNLIATDGWLSFSQAFTVVMTTEREYGDAAPVPVKELRHAA